MNAIFFIIFVISTAVLLFIKPEEALTAMLSGGRKAVSLTIEMTVIYAVWMGVAQIMQATGLNERIAKILKPINRFIYGEVSEKASGYLALNMSANILGMGGIATPMGINAAEELEKQNNYEAISMLLIITSTSIEILPTTVISLRSSFESTSPADIFLPTILATAVSTVVGILLCKIFSHKKHN